MSVFGLSGVELSYPRAHALDGVDVEVTPGDITVVAGPDGAGKTSICRVLVGLVRPDAGRVHRPPEGRVGYQPEASGTWAELTVEENLAFVARAHGMPADARRQELLEVAGLSAAADRPAGKLSGGMRQKLAVLMAILARPSLVVLDEPTTGLDPVSRGELWRLLVRTAAEGVGVLATTSYLDEAERADRVVLLDEGRMVATGSAVTITASMPGVIHLSEERPAGRLAWRRGRQWRVWNPDATDGDGRVRPDLEDVVTVAALRRRGG